MLCSLNPATLMPNDHPEIPLCHCEDLLDSSGQSLITAGHSPPEAEADLFIHKHSLVVSGVRRAAVQRPLIRHKPCLAAGHIYQNAELTAFT